MGVRRSWRLERLGFSAKLVYGVCAIQKHGRDGYEIVWPLIVAENIARRLRGTAAFVSVDGIQ